MNVKNHQRDTDGHEDPILKVANSWEGVGRRGGGGGGGGGDSTDGKTRRKCLLNRPSFE